MSVILIKYVTEGIENLYIINNKNQSLIIGKEAGWLTNMTVDIISRDIQGLGFEESQKEQTTDKTG